MRLDVAEATGAIRMNHGMRVNDVQFGLEMAWHNLTTVVKAIANGFRNKAGESFDAKRVPIMHPTKGTPTDYSWIVGTDDGEVIGVPVATSYQFATFARFWELVNDARIGAGPSAKVVSLGTYQGRAKRYASISLGADWETFKIDGNQIQMFLNLHDAIDKTGELIAKGSTFRQVCQNTCNFSLNEKSDFKAGIRHTANHEARIANLEKMIDAYRGQSALYKRFFENAAETKIEQPAARNLFAGFIGGGEEIATRSLNQVDRLTELFQTGKGNNGRNVFDAVNAVTDYYTHESSGGENPWRQVTSSEIGAGSRNKAEFIDRIKTKEYTVNRVAIRELVEMGAKTLALS